jgi:hypothetical protein
MAQDPDVRAALARLARFFDEEDREEAATFFADAEVEALNPNLADLEGALRARLDAALASGLVTSSLPIARMAARSGSVGGEGPSGSLLYVEGADFQVSEDDDAVLHVRGPVPDRATHLQFGADVYEVNRLGPEEVTVPDLTPAAFETLCEEALSQGRLLVSWVRR